MAARMSARNFFMFFSPFLRSMRGTILYYDICIVADNQLGWPSLSVSRHN